ncbi:MAG: hybrid sensor histidine kinase/response regulator [Deltaproteobacteria bacterium]|nr:MAG: hybrid sensor histidine kinase/response regulator [Deltaproteobacteria bacterium]
MNQKSDQTSDETRPPAPEDACRAATEAAHDLGNLLTVIVGYSHLALTGVDPTSPTAELLNEIHVAAEAGVELMERIRTLGTPQPSEGGPRTAARTPAEAHDEPVTSTAEAPIAPGRILVVEDDFLVRRTACLLLLDAGFEVLEAEHPAAALALPREDLERVSLVLTDMMMPGMSGRAMVRRLEAAYPNLRAVYMSGLSKQHLVENGELEADLPLLEKPFGEETLTRCVRHALADGLAPR